MLALADVGAECVPGLGGAAERQQLQDSGGPQAGVLVPGQQFDDRSDRQFQVPDEPRQVEVPVVHLPVPAPVPADAPVDQVGGCRRVLRRHPRAQAPAALQQPGQGACRGVLVSPLCHVPNRPSAPDGWAAGAGGGGGG